MRIKPGVLPFRNAHCSNYSTTYFLPDESLLLIWGECWITTQGLSLACTVSQGQFGVASVVASSCHTFTSADVTWNAIWSNVWSKKDEMSKQCRSSTGELLYNLESLDSELWKNLEKKSIPRGRCLSACHLHAAPVVLLTLRLPCDGDQTSLLVGSGCERQVSGILYKFRHRILVKSLDTWAHSSCTWTS